MSIGQRIKTIRLQQGLSIDDIASKLGKNRTTIYRYENGNIENLPLGILDSLANALNTTPARLMGWEDSRIDSSNVINENISTESLYVSKWFNEIGDNVFDEEECKKIMEYARFLLSMRER